MMTVCEVGKHIFALPLQCQKRILSWQHCTLLCPKPIKSLQNDNFLKGLFIFRDPVCKPLKDEANLFLNELRFLKRKISKNNLAFSGHSGKEPFSLQLPSDLPFGVQIGSL